MFCLTCGHQNPLSAYYCATCGAQLSQAGQAVPIPPQQPPFGNQYINPGGPGYQSATPVYQPFGSPMPQGSAVPASPAAQINSFFHPAGQGGIKGIACNILQRQELYTSYSAGMQFPQTILTFRLEQFDSSGNLIRVVPVEMRGRSSLIGFISDGDQVEVFGTVKGGVVRAKQAYNLTTGATVKANSLSKGCLWVIAVPAVLLLIGPVLQILGSVFHFAGGLLLIVALIVLLYKFFGGRLVSRLK